MHPFDAEEVDIGQKERGPLVIMYSHDAFGMGHLRRNTSIASRRVVQIPGSSVLMLTGLPSGLFLSYRLALATSRNSRCRWRQPWKTQQ